MSTRRGFLGMLAAAPIAAPAAAKEAFAPMLHNSGLVSGTVSPLTVGIDWGRPDSDSIARLRELMRAPTPWPPEHITVDYDNVIDGCLSADKIVVRSLQRVPVYGWAIPNRLYGATINSEGDVV